MRLQETMRKPNCPHEMLEHVGESASVECNQNTTAKEVPNCTFERHDARPQKSGLCVLRHLRMRLDRPEKTRKRLRESDYPPTHILLSHRRGLACQLSVSVSPGGEVLWNTVS